MIFFPESRRWWDCGKETEAEWTSEGERKKEIPLLVCKPEYGTPLTKVCISRVCVKRAQKRQAGWHRRIILK